MARPGVLLRRPVGSNSLFSENTARRKEERAWEKRRKLQEQAIAKAERALEEAKLVHEAKIKELEKGCC